MPIGQIIKEKQPEVYKKLMKIEKSKKELSFNDIDKLMRKNNGIDSTRCRGR